MITSPQYGQGWQYRARTAAVRDNPLQVMPGRDSHIARFGKRVLVNLAWLALCAAVVGIAVALLVTVGADLPDIF